MPLNEIETMLAAIKQARSRFVSCLDTLVGDLPEGPRNHRAAKTDERRAAFRCWYCAGSTMRECIEGRCQVAALEAPSRSPRGGRSE